MVHIFKVSLRFSYPYSSVVKLKSSFSFHHACQASGPKMVFKFKLNMLCLLSNMKMELFSGYVMGFKGQFKHDNRYQLHECITISSDHYRNVFLFLNMYLNLMLYTKYLDILHFHTNEVDNLN